ncbi:chaoptin [Eurosta solidaginis]|uniref:chaoptin n=1 Tax=Eurosta solidaginis TaxID=178769 RepID=UPI0035311B0C
MNNLLICCTFILQLFVFVKPEYAFNEPKYKCPKMAKLFYPCNCWKNTDVGIYVRCENVNIATLSIALDNLGALGTPVEHLEILKGHFARLYGPVFAKVRTRLLTIADTPIETIEDYPFFGVNKTVEELHLLHTNLSSFTPLSFGVNTGNAKELIIDGHSLMSINKTVFDNQIIGNKLEVLRIINGPLNDISIEAFQPLRKLKVLDLHGNQLETLKKNQFKNLRSVEVLDISFNNLKKLEAQHIADMTKLGWCNASNNALTEMSRGTFARNSVLKLLNLSHNNISRLDANSFRGMRFLRRLFLSDNKINDVGRGTFGSIGKIGTIDLARNFLKKVEFQMFSQLNYVELIDLAENNITVVEKHSFKDIYQAMINISHNMLEKIEPLAFENCVNITVLDLSFNRLTNFSRNTFDPTTFTTEFQLSYNFFTNLAQVPFQNMTGIKVINASHNYIAEVPKNCFPKLYELHTIDISYNNISLIANGVFQTLFSLRSLNLSHNSLTEIKSSVFGTLPTLLEMNLSNNKLTSIMRGALAKLTSLRFLNLSNNDLQKLFQIPISLNELNLEGNRLTAIPAGTWPVMNSLLFLNLNDNQIGDSLTAQSFTGLLVLQKLWLNKNGITHPPFESLAGMSTLQYLHLEQNNITILEKSAFGKLPVLFELNLYKNGVTDISKRSFEGLLQLLTLNLSKNDIQTIPNDVFIGLPSLRKLDLSFNKLSKLDNKTNGVLDDLLSLEDLNLSHNKISFVTKKTFPSSQYIPYNLKYLDLSYNQMPVLTYDITFGTKKLLTLNLSNNNINEIRRGVLANITELQSLDISYNELSNLAAEEHIFDLPKNLTKINLSNNQIYKVPFLNFQKDIQFQSIDLRNNNLTEFPQLLVNILRNGTVVYFAGNPLHCSCGARPLKHFTMSKSSLSNDLKNIKCKTPTFHQNQILVEVLDENLQCILEDRDRYKGAAYEELTDVLFRDIKITDKGNLTVRFFVTAARDIADFVIYIRNSENDILYQGEAAYNERVHEIPILNIRERFKGERAEVCIVSKDSNGNTGRWFSAQCTNLPDLKEKRKGLFLFNTSNFAERTSNRKTVIPILIAVITTILSADYNF